MKNGVGRKAAFQLKSCQPPKIARSKLKEPAPTARNSHSRGSPSSQKKGGSTLVLLKKNRRLEAKFEVLPNSLAILMPIRTYNEANSTEHWTKRARRHRSQQRAVALLLRPYLTWIKLPCSIELTRFASRKLDAHDNLPMSFKFITDTVCALLTQDTRPGRADDDERILSITYKQICPSPYGIKVLFTW